MSLNPCLKNTALLEITQLKKLPQHDVENFLQKLDNIKNGKLYVSAVQRLLKLREQDSLDVIEKLIELNIVGMRYQIKIDDTLYPEEYKQLKDIPSSVYNDELYEDLIIDKEKNVFVFFRVNNYE